jgi:hypothetical protein
MSGSSPAVASARPRIGNLTFHPKQDRGGFQLKGDAKNAIKDGVNKVADAANKKL